MTVRRTYLDFNATRPLRAEAREAMLSALGLTGNPSSVHAEGRAVRAKVDNAREAVAALVGARESHVIFTSGATEANATVLASGWSTVLLSGLEHDSVRAAALASGARVIEIPVRTDGRFDSVALETLAIDATSSTPPGKGLICLQLANNETGVIQPLGEAAAIARRCGFRLHCDAVQGVGRIAVDCTTLGADFVTLSSHKFGGPKGAGAIICVNGVPLRPLLTGGGQERGRRAGTENVVALAGFGAAARAASAELEYMARQARLRDGLEEDLRQRVPDAWIVGANVPRLANTSCVALPGHSAETLVIGLDLAGVAVSAGAACSSGKVGQSATLAAMGLPPDLAQSAIRVSIGPETTAADTTAFLEAFSRMAARRRAA